MSHRLALAFAFIVAFSLTGCAANNVPAPIETAPPAVSESPEPEQALPATVGITSTGLTVSYPDRTVSIEFDDVSAALELFEEISGTPATTSPGPAPFDFIFHDWEGVRVIEGQGTTFLMNISASMIGETRLETAGGVSVGSPRDAVLAAGGTTVGNDPAALTLLPRDVPGTNSLTRPGQVGQAYVLVIAENDIVTRLIAPSDDFSDL